MSHTGTVLPRPHLLVVAGALLTLFASSAQAQDTDGRAIPKAAHHAHLNRTPRQAEQTADTRSLTINRRPEIAPDDGFDDGENSATVDGPTRYNSIATFDPVPYVDSGLQYPYGLDGVGGYGSDIGVRAGQDTALYQRGP